MLVFVLVLSGALLGQKESSDSQLQTESHHCPTWTYFNSDTHSCQCGANVYHIILCGTEDGNVSDVGVLFRFCMTQNKELTKSVVGPCPYNNNIKTYHNDAMYVSLPSNVTELNRIMCGRIARTGQLCGGCMEGHSPPVYSYYPQCVNCTAGTNNWPKYLAVSLLPTTAFFIGLLVFRFRATSPLLNGYILFCQILTSPPILRLLAYRDYERHREAHAVHILVYIYSAFLSIWNLDFFRLVYMFLLASQYLHTASAVSGLHHSSLSSCPHHPHLHTSQTPLQQLETCGVAVEAFHRMLCSLSKAVGHSELTCGCLCNLLPPLLCQIFKCFI